MNEFKVNERTFQGVLSTPFNKAKVENPLSNLSPAEQEQNVGVGEFCFSGTIISSSAGPKLKVFIELENSNRDATVEEIKNKTRKIFILKS